VLVLATVPHGRVSYYLASLGDEDGGARLEAGGVWLGSGAAQLGLAGTAVGEADLAAVLAGRSPSDGESLFGRPDRRRVAAYDCTFSCPKSVSVLALVAPEPLASAARAAHDAAVASAISYLERQAGAVRRVESGRPERRRSGIIAATVQHCASRSADPHLHTHALVANLGRDGAGSWSALDGRPLFVERAAAAALYESELRRRLARDLGVVFHLSESGVLDLVGIPASLRREFSQRTRQIAAEMAAHGHHSARAARVAALITRAPKDPSATLQDLAARWQLRTRERGIPDARWARVAPGRDVGVPPPDDSVLLRFEEPFARRDLLRLLATEAHDGELISALEARADRLLRLPEVRPLSGDASPSREADAGPDAFAAGIRYTTPAIEALSRRVETVLADAIAHRGETEIVAGQLIVAAEATAGALAPALRSARRAGRSVRVAASDGETARRLGAAFGVPGFSTASAATAVQRSIVVIPGAESLPLESLAEIAEAARRGSGALVLLISTARSGRTARSRTRLRALARQSSERLGPQGWDIAHWRGPEAERHGGIGDEPWRERPAEIRELSLGRSLFR
jgi:conjugative relaxase-like TrwC/TraI family protein